MARVRCSTWWSRPAGLRSRGWIIPANAKLPARNPYLKAWKDLPKDEQRLYARFMEVYAGFLEYTDYEVGRLVEHLKTSGQFDNTVFLNFKRIQNKRPSFK